MNGQHRFRSNKKYILFPADIGTSWIGGVYYIKNIIYSVLQNKSICDRFSILIITTKECKSIFSVFENECEIYIHRANGKIGIQLEYLRIFAIYNVGFIYNMGRISAPIRAGRNGAYWIADFQHVYYPEFFTKGTISKRDKSYRKIAKKKNTLIVSSDAARRDYEGYYHGVPGQAKVVHFVSFVENEIKSLSSEYEEEVLKKHGLTRYKYIYIPNQFWKHKNQLSVLRAVKLLPLEITQNYRFVFTGNLNSYRDNCYVNAIRSLIKEEPLNDCCILLGFLDRTEQLCIMKNCCFIVQPSLFEGWSTVVEDVKVLDKSIILSDIDVHREQNYDKSFFFDPRDHIQLSEMIIDCIERKDYMGDISRGICRMRKDAESYSKQLEFIIDSE